MRRPPLARSTGPLGGAQLLVLPLLMLACGGDRTRDSSGTPASGSDPPLAATPSQDTIDRLESLGYVEATYDPQAERKGVLLHRPDKTFPGLNFYTSRDLPAAFLIDMEGQILHRWRARTGKWQHAELRPNGHVVALIKDRALLELSFDSEILWRHSGRVHHDHWTTDDGRIYVLSRRERQIPELHRSRDILADDIVVLSDSGEVLEEISLVDILLQSPYAFLLPRVSHRSSTDGDGNVPKAIDLLHTNHIEVFDGSLSHPLFARGNVLLSVRQMHTVLILDLQNREVLWAWGPSNLIFQHHPTLLPNGHLLIFNNGLYRSQIVELDPSRLEVVWTYEDADFFSALRGSNQRLPNGNTLITESDTGYVFEVTAEGEKVWEFANYQVNDDDERSAIWRMLRFEEAKLAFLDRLDRR